MKHSKGARTEKKEHPWTTWAEAERIDREHKALEHKKKKKLKKGQLVRFKTSYGWVSFKARG